MRVLGVSVISAVCMQVGLRACVFARYLKGLRGVDYVGLQ
eukprot:COSAG03_NODE_16826_length_391_cov_1.058219_2_plen_39_part_01